MDLLVVNQFFELMNKHIALYTELRDFETEKMLDISANHFDKLDEYVKKEEAFVLRVGGMEATRDKFFQENGLDGKSMREIICLLPEDMQQKGTEIYNEFYGIISDVKVINRKIALFSEVRMHNLQKAIDKIENDKTSAINSGAKSDDGVSSLSTKV